MNLYNSAKALWHKGLVLTLLCAPLSSWAYTQDSKVRWNVAKHAFPNLPEPNQKPAYFRFDPSELTLGYRTHLNKWSATADYSAAGNPVLNVNYGYATSKTHASGAHLHVGKYHRQIFVNEIFTPWDDVRLRVASGQRLENDYHLPDYSEAATVSQSSYLVEVKKLWTGSPVSRTGLTVFDVKAHVRPVGSGTHDDAGLVAMSRVPDFPTGSLQGYAMNFKLHPSVQSLIELDIGASRRTSILGSASQKPETEGAYRLHLTHYLNDCSHVKTEYRVFGNENSVRITMKTGAWRFGVSGALASDSSLDYGVLLGYTMPLYGSVKERRQCGFNVQNAYKFRPILDDAIAGPPALPMETRY